MAAVDSESKDFKPVEPGPSSSDKEFVLKKESELRVENEEEKDKVLHLTLKDGLAEVFGTELLKGQTYEFPPGAKFAVFTWHGCTIQLSGHVRVAYTSEETPMLFYVNTHAALEKLRKAAQAQGKPARGPKVMIAGPTDSGKSTLTRTLLNYAVRSGWKPTYVDLDVGQNEITIPGALSATPVEHPVAVTDTSTVSMKTPIVYYFGHTSPSAANSQYLKLIDRLARSVKARMEAIDISRESGLIMNTCGWVDGAGYQHLLHVAQAFEVDTILVLGQDRLWSQLKQDPKLTTTTVIKLPKSGGVVERDAEYRKRARARRIREYFYGGGGEALQPHPKVVAFKDLNVYKLGGGAVASSAALPIGQKSLLDPDRAVKVEPSLDMTHQILAVSYAKDQNGLLDANVAGFVHVQSVDLKKRTATLLCPAPGPLPEKCLVMGSVKWFELT